MEEEMKIKKEEEEKKKEEMIKNQKKFLPPCPRCANKIPQDEDPKPDLPVIKSKAQPPDWAIHPHADMLKDHLPGKEAIEAAGLPYHDPNESSVSKYVSDKEAGPIITPPN